jgi:TonB family protein
MTYQSIAEGGELDFFSLLRSPFLFSSLLFHAALLLLALKAATLTAPRPEANTPISVQLIEARDGGSPNKSIGPGSGPGGPRTMPKLGVAIAPQQRTGKLDSGSVETTAPSNDPVETAPPPKPAALPGPKVLAADRRDAVNINETSADSLVRLPTREGPTKLPGSAATELEANQRSLAALKGIGDGPGIKALKEGAQIPGALKGSGAGSGPYGVPGGSRTGTGLTGGGTGSGSGGGGGATGLGGFPDAEWNRYRALIRQRVYALWKYPESVTGVHNLSVRFALDRTGKLTEVDVIESSDSRLNSSAIDAMKRASPFPPIPESLKVHIANEPLIMTFEVTNKIRR